MPSHWRRYLRFLGPDVAADVDEELTFHLEQRIAEYERTGHSHEEAVRLTRERFGDAAAIAQELRAHDERHERRERRRERLTILRHDLRFAARTLRRAAGWTVGVVLTLALGIGLSTAVFTIADAVLLRPLPVRAQERVVVAWGRTRDGRTDHFPLLYRDADQYVRATQFLSDVAFFSYGGAQPVPIDLAGGVIRMRRSLVSGGYFDLLGTRPLLGRALRPEDDRTGATPVAVLSYTGWQRFFGGDSGVVGRRFVLHFDGTSYRVIGVMPRGLDYPQGVDFWTPVVPNSGPLGDQPIYAELNVIGRLRPGASLADVRAEMTRFFDTLSRTTSGWRNIVGVAHSLTDDAVGNVGPAILAFAAAAGLLLLMTCINVANLLLVRGMARGRELALRTALGAGRRRIVRQLLTESVMLALAGGVIGALFAVLAVRVFVFLAPAGTPRLNEIHVDGSILVFASAVTALATLLFALAPAVLSSRIAMDQMLRAGARQSGGSRGIRLGTQSLVIGQMALALLVLCVAGLLARSLVALEGVNVAFDPARLLVVELALPGEYMGDAPGQRALVEQLMARLDAVPGVRSVAPTYTPPFAAVGGVFGRMAAPEGQPPDEAAQNPVVDYELATPAYFTTLGIPLIRGRAFTNADRKGSLPVVILSESAARQYWPDEDPVGKRLVRGPGDLLTVVGVAGDTHYRDLRAPRPAVYFPLGQSPFVFTPTTLIVRTDARAVGLVPEIRRVVGEVAPGVAVVGAATGETFIGSALAQPRMNALLLALFSGAALILAAVGLFGVMATSVRQRTRELAVRMALGATPSALRRMVLAHALVLASAGLGLGLVASLATTRALRALLFNVSPSDAVTLAVAAAVLLGVALGAAYLPARRAQRVDPNLSLRAD